MIDIVVLQLAITSTIVTITLEMIICIDYEITI
jgi:hypothetical protein